MPLSEPVVTSPLVLAARLLLPAKAPANDVPDPLVEIPTVTLDPVLAAEAPENEAELAISAAIAFLTAFMLTFPNDTR